MEVDTRRQMGGRHGGRNANLVSNTSGCRKMRNGGRNGGRHQEKNGGRHQETNGGRHQETNGRSKWRSTPGEKRRLHFPPNLTTEIPPNLTAEGTDERTDISCLKDTLCSLLICSNKNKLFFAKMSKTTKNNFF